MPDGLVVREVGPDASGVLADLEVAAFDAPWSADAVRALLDDGLTRAWVAGCGDRVVGGAVVRVVAGEGELLRLAVRPEARRQGIGRAVLAIVLSAVADACPEGVYLEVRSSNVAARQLYARLEFVDCGRRRDYYQTPSEDAVLMRWRPIGRASMGS